MQDEDYTTECLLDYEFIKNYYRLIAVDLSRQKELDADPKAIQQIEFVGQLKKLNNDNNNNSNNNTTTTTTTTTNNNNPESMFILTIKEIKDLKRKIKILSRKCNIIITDGKLSRSDS